MLVPVVIGGSVQTAEGGGKKSNLVYICWLHTQMSTKYEWLLQYGHEVP